MKANANFEPKIQQTESRQWPVAPASPKAPVFPEARVVPRTPAVPESPESLVSPVSEGQATTRKKDKVLKALGARNACTTKKSESRRLFKLARDLSAIERGTGRELTIAEITPAFQEWYGRSQPFLDPARTRDDYFAELVAALPKVRVPTGQGDTFNKALAAVLKLLLSQLPLIPGMQDASECWRRLVALHREISRRCGGNTYFLSCRDAAKVFPELSYRAVSNMNLVLERLGVIKIVRVGDQRPGGKASKFRYLLAQSENGAEEDDGGFEL